MVKVFKFGGASVHNAQSIINLANILKKFTNQKIVTVISAIDKTTRELTKLTDLYTNNKDYSNQLQSIITKHHHIIEQLFPDKTTILQEFNTLVNLLNKKLEEKPSSNYDFEYDQIVIFGELFSTIIISHYLATQALSSQWVDIRKYIKTDSIYRNARVNWEQTQNLLQNNLQINIGQFIITQGFIASNNQGLNTTLGIEGSDFTAAIIAYALNAAELVVWKDVAGFYSSDPKMFDNVVKLDAVSFHEAVELAYYGAKIIHPKTIKPLQNKQIPLVVKSFIEPDNKGTIIRNSTGNKTGINPPMPVFISKNNQILISIAPLDFSFIAEDNLSDIFALLARFRIKVNLMQNSAISFSVCVDHVTERINPFLNELRKEYKVLYNEKLTLITIRHYNTEIIKKLTHKRKIFVQQKSRHTARFIVK